MRVSAKECMLLYRQVEHLIDNANPAIAYVSLLVALSVRFRDTTFEERGDLDNLAAQLMTAVLKQPQSSAPQLKATRTKGPAS